MLGGGADWTNVDIAFEFSFFLLRMILLNNVPYYDN